MSKKNQIEVNFRDIQILQFVFEQRVTSFKQLATRFFANTLIPTAFKRLEKLYKAGYLTKSFALWEAKRTAFYGSTDKGIKLLTESYRYKITHPDFKSDSITHDLGLVRLRIRLEKTKMLVEYLSESMLQSCSTLTESEKLSGFARVNSDAVLYLNMPTAKIVVALEYEISDKAERRYTKKLTDYYFSRNIGAVLYVCGDASIENLIRQTDKEADQKYPAKIFTCLEKTIQNSPDRLPFLNRDNGILSLE